MPKAKPSKELTTEEVVKRLFPKQVRENARKVAQEKDLTKPVK